MQTLPPDQVIMIILLRIHRSLEESEQEYVLRMHEYINAVQVASHQQLSLGDKIRRLCRFYDQKNASFCRTTESLHMRGQVLTHICRHTF